MSCGVTDRGAAGVFTEAESDFRRQADALHLSTPTPSQVLNYTEFDEIDKPGNYIGDDATRRRRLQGALSAPTLRAPRPSSAADLAAFLSSKLGAGGTVVPVEAVKAWLEEALADGGTIQDSAEEEPAALEDREDALE